MGKFRRRTRRSNKKGGRKTRRRLKGGAAAMRVRRIRQLQKAGRKTRRTRRMRRGGSQKHTFNKGDYITYYSPTYNNTIIGEIQNIYPSDDANNPFKATIYEHTLVTIGEVKDVPLSLLKPWNPLELGPISQLKLGA